MHRREFLSQSIVWPLSIGATGLCCGCGTIIHNERVGMPHSRDLDWSVVALDALGLILFFVPGVIAFVVDFSTGAIYLPPDHCAPYPYSSNGPNSARPQSNTHRQQVVDLQRVNAPGGRLDQSTIERVVNDHTGQQILLTEPSTRVSQLATLDQFGPQRRTHERDHSFGNSAKQLLARLLPA